MCGFSNVVVYFVQLSYVGIEGWCVRLVYIMWIPQNIRPYCLLLSSVGKTTSVQLLSEKIHTLYFLWDQTYCYWLSRLCIHTALRTAIHVCHGLTPCPSGSGNTCWSLCPLRRPPSSSPRTTSRRLDRHTWYVQYTGTCGTYSTQAHVVRTVHRHTWYVQYTGTSGTYSTQAHVVRTARRHTWYVQYTGTRRYTVYIGS